jgi:septal ring factor EnvC (AmiA/AmiB activator)
MSHYVFNKYIFANIKLPLEIKDDGTVEILRDYVHINFEKCDELPEKQSSSANYAFLMNNLLDLMNSNKNDDGQVDDCLEENNDESEEDFDQSLEDNGENQNEELEENETITATFNENIDPDMQNEIMLFIKKEELNNRQTSSRNNMSFKKKRYNMNRFTSKRR